MVGIVLVSHSQQLAQATRDLASQMGGEAAAIVPAGGVDVTGGALGTDAARIAAAIESVYSPDGVVVLMDLGSAILSAQMAVEDLLPPEWSQNILLLDAPLVEGAVTAAVQAALGGCLEDVAAEARRGLAAKSAQLAQPTASPPDTKPGQTGQREIHLTIDNPAGLHARPAALFVQTAAGFESSIHVRNISTASSPANAKSITGVMRLAVRQGQEITISAVGPDADRALAALRKLVEAGLDEVGPAPVEVNAPAPEVSPVEPVGGLDPPAPPSSREDEQVLSGLAASEGFAIGPARFYQAGVNVPKRIVDDPEDEWLRFLDSLPVVRGELTSVQVRAAGRVGAYDARIFEAQRQFLDDPALLDGVSSRIHQERVSAEYAVLQTIARLVAELESLGIPLLAQRAVDLQDVGHRLVSFLGGGANQEETKFEEPVVILARELTPSQMVNIDPERVLGICTSSGGTMSHAAILARSLGIPTVVGLGNGLESIKDGDVLIVDGTVGQVWVNPENDTIDRYRDQQVLLASLQREALELSSQPAVTLDGRRIEVAANVSGLSDVDGALAGGAEGVGVLRTEFLYLDRETPPSEEEQVETYRAIAGRLNGLPLIVRTLDIGGDKPAAYMEMPPELNPFLGRRGLRLSLAYPDLFKTQLRAILRTAAEYPVKVMLPMVTGVEDLHQARLLLEQAGRELETAGIPYASRFELGVMVEVPSAALSASRLLEEADFLSVGANDLTQYTLAVDRTNAACAPWFDPLHPAVLSLIHNVVSAAHSVGKWVGVCGEVAGDTQAIPVLVGLGVDELSMSPIAIPRAKQVIRRLDYARAQDLAARALEAGTALAVRELAQDVGVLTG